MKLTESEVQDKVSEILSTLRDERFGNSEQRAKLIDLFTSLYNSKDQRARKFFKKLGDFCTDAVDGILGNESEEEESENEIEIEIEDGEVSIEIENEDDEDLEEDFDYDYIDDYEPYVSYFDDSYYD